MSSYQHDRRPFLYLISWTELNASYVGIKWAKGCQPIDLWTKYFTSSCLVKELRDDYGEPDHVEVLCEGSVDDVLELEAAIISEFALHLDSRWLNRAIGNKGFRGAVVASDEHRTKLSKALKGKPKPEGFGQRSTERQTGKPKPWNRGPKPPEYCAAMSARMMGHKLSEETKAKISAAKKAYEAARPDRKPPKIRRTKAEVNRERWADPEYKARVVAAREKTKREKREAAREAAAQLEVTKKGEA